MDPLISIIIPVYNTGQYIDRCITSVIKQKYHRIQILLINDGSTDNSGRLCDEISNEYKNVIVIHQKNAGLAAARNTGIDNCSGDYIMFLDSDDYLEEDTLSTVVPIIIQNKADIVSYKYRRVNSIERINYNTQPFSGSVKKISSFDFLVSINQRKLGSSVCTKVFNKSLFVKHRFAPNRLNEDYLFVSEMLLDNSDLNIYYTDYVGYNYYVRLGSISNSGVGKSSIDAVQNTLVISELAKQKNPEIVKYVIAYSVYQAKTALLLHSRLPKKGENEFTDECFRIIRKNIKFIRNSFMNSKDRFVCYIYAYSPYRFARLFNVLSNRYFMKK